MRAWIVLVAVAAAGAARAESDAGVEGVVIEACVAGFIDADRDGEPDPVGDVDAPTERALAFAGAPMAASVQSGVVEVHLTTPPDDSTTLVFGIGRTRWLPFEGSSGDPACGEGCGAAPRVFVGPFDTLALDPAEPVVVGLAQTAGRPVWVERICLSLLMWPRLDGGVGSGPEEPEAGAGRESSGCEQSGGAPGAFAGFGVALVAWARRRRGAGASR